MTHYHLDCSAQVGDSSPSDAERQGKSLGDAQTRAGRNEGRGEGWPEWRSSAKDCGDESSEEKATMLQDDKPSGFVPIARKGDGQYAAVLEQQPADERSLLALCLLASDCAS